MCQNDVRPPVHMKRGPRAFFRVSTGDSDIPSYCEMKDETAFKPLHGNPAFFRVRASRCPLHLRQQTQGPSNRPIAEGSLLLRCLWKVGLTLHSSHVISSRLEMIWGKRSFHRVAVLNWCSSRLETGVSGNHWNCLKEVKPLVVCDVEGEMALEPMQENRASS